MKTEEMQWTPYGSLSLRWAHGERYMEQYGGIVEYEGVLDWCDEHRLWNLRATHGRHDERKARDLAYVPGGEDDDFLPEYLPEAGHTVRLLPGERVVVAQCTPAALRTWESPAYITGCLAQDWFLYEGEEDCRIVAEGPESGVKVMRLGDLLDDAVEVMREVCTEEAVT